MNTLCLENLVGLKTFCPPGTPEPQFYLDDVEGMTAERLSNLANAQVGSGENLFKSLVQSSARLMAADIETLIPTNYRIVQSLAEMCSSCNFSGFYNAATSSGSGIIVKNMSNSKFSSLIISSLKVKVNSTGNFTLRIDPKEGAVKDIVTDFVAGEELTIEGIAFETQAKQVRIYFYEPEVQLYTITCPANSSCGCGGGPKTTASDIAIGGLMNGIETTTQYAILPCVNIRCSHDAVICKLAETSPRLAGLAMLYRVASKAFEENVLSERINRTASYNKEEKEALSDYYLTLYYRTLRGDSKTGVLGLKQALNQNLKMLKDRCVTCDSPNTIAWAIG